MRFDAGMPALSVFRACLLLTAIAVGAATLVASEYSIINANPVPSQQSVAERELARQALRAAPLETQVRYLLDRAEITDIVTAYGYSLDMRDWELHQSLFTDDYEVNNATGWRQQTSAERVVELRRFFKRFTSTQHLGFPLTFKIEDDEAYVTASLNARHFADNGKAADNTLLFGQYELWLVRTERGWRINRLNMANLTQVTTSAGMLTHR